MTATLARIQQKYGIPGWVDLQVNGHAGVSFCEPTLTVDQVCEATRALAAAGTAAYLPTVVTTPVPVLLHCLSVLGEAREHPDLQENLLGIHLEGPFLSTEPGAKGAHPADHMRHPTVESFKRFQDAARGHIRLLTLAPELPGALDLIESISGDVVCALGHSLATYAQIESATKAGLRMGTHLGNAVPTQIHRHENPIIAQFALREITSSLITDGFHIPPPFIRAAISAKGVDRLVVVSDQTHLAGMPPGHYSLGITPVVLEPDGFLHMRDEPYLAGSSRTMAQCMEYLDSLAIVSDEDLYQLGYAGPLRLMLDTRNVD